MTKRAVLYARVSSDDTQNQGRNLEGQLAMCREHALARGWNVVAELAEDDRGVSGASLDLEKLNQALDMARDGAMDVLVVREIDRFARRLAKQLLIEEEFKRADVAIEYVLGDYPDTPEGNLMKHVKATIAEYEREMINERMTRGRHQKVQSGSVIVGNRPPYGYRVLKTEDNRHTLIVDEEEAAIVKLVFTWYTQGDGSVGPMSLRAIAKRLTEMGVPTYTQKRGIKIVPNRRFISGRWSSTTVHDLLKKETYTGIWRYGKTSQKGGKMVKNLPSEISTQVPAIIETHVWMQVQERLAQNKRNSRRNSKYHYLVGRRVQCASCGGRMHGCPVSKNGRVYKYYVCNARRFPDIYEHKCEASRFMVDQVDATIWQWLQSLLAAPESLALGLQMQRHEAEKELIPMRKQADAIEVQIDSLRKQEERLLDLYLDGALTKQQWSKRQEQLTLKLTALATQLEDTKQCLIENQVSDEQIAGLEEFARKIARGMEAIEDDFEAKRYIVDILDVQAALGLDKDGDKVVRATCSIKPEELCIVSDKTHHCC